ncbi:MAG: sugar transferase [Anaerolineae bacterium]|jgi:exopolysaccharide biosynthesis polyprenyl glycosylphosphotransferase|nr:sugar transferase [Chloroflexota bacterium]
MADRQRSALLPSRWLYVKPFVDAILFVLAFLIAYYLRYEIQWLRSVETAYVVPLRVYGPSIAGLTAILVLVSWVEGAYRLRRGRSLLDELFIASRSIVLGIAIVIVIVFFATPNYYSRLIFGYTGITALLLVAISRTLEKVIRDQRHKRGLGIVRVLLVGVGESGRSVVRTIMARPELGYRIIGFLDDDPEKVHAGIGPYPGLGNTSDLEQVIRSQRIDQVIVALPSANYRRTLQVARTSEQAGARVRIVPDLFRIAISSVVLDSLDGIPLLGVREPELLDWKHAWKRLSDIIISVLALILLSPLFLLVALAIRLDSPGPIIFKQTRVGRNQRQFTFLKFRTMSNDAEARLAELKSQNEADGPIFKIRDDPRRTRIGRVLRRFSIDEMPQFWNVLRGELSVVGPRPPLPSEVQEYEPWHLRRLEVSPGITGLWQVSGRSDLTFDEMVLLDIYYIENWSPLLDLRILLKTVPTVLFGNGAY